jgi:7-cyano-7-deazaguanine synthase in queuosine biosynthesis
LTVDYGQRHRRELEAARRVGAQLGVRDHRIVAVDLRQFGGSALTSDVAVPRGRQPDEMMDIPATYVPARNTVFLSLALAWAESLEAEDIYIGVNALDYSVAGDARVWIRGPRWTCLLAIREICELPPDDYQTPAVDLETLEICWRRVTQRSRHDIRGERCFKIRLERGQELTVTEDHSLFTIDPSTARIVPVKGAHVTQGMPIVVPFDLSDIRRAWDEDLAAIDLHELARRAERSDVRWPIVAERSFLTNRLRSTRIPLDLPVTDDFLYIVGLWLAEGGKSLESPRTALQFSIGAIPGAVECLRKFFEGYRVRLSSHGNDFDYSASSSVFAALFEHVGLFGTAKRGEKQFPTFFWQLSQRQRRIVVAGVWDGDGSHVFHGQTVLAQKSHAIVHDIVATLILDGIFPIVKTGPRSQLLLFINRARDFQRFADLYPFRHLSKRADYEREGVRTGRDKAIGLWKCAGLWDAVSAAPLAPGEKTRVYNRGGKYDRGVRAQRSAFAGVPALNRLASSKLAFLRVADVTEVRDDVMYDLSVEGAENFLANGILAHNSGYPDCRPEYIDAFERMANLATKAGVEGRSRFRIHTPLIALSKADIVRRALLLHVDPGLTWSCYDPTPEGRPCDSCDACVLRRKGFLEAGVADPLSVD